MRQRLAVVLALIFAGTLALTSCGPSADAPPSSDGAVQTVPDDSSSSGAVEAGSDNETESDAGTGEVTIPDGARAASPDFPFPVPEGWAEIDPFTEGKIGKKDAMSAVYERPADAEAAAATYMQLLKAAGITAFDNLVGAVVNDASIAVNCTINGIAYRGSLDFDTDASGTPRVVINLVEARS